MRLKPLDIVILGLSAAAIAFSAALVYGHRSGEENVSISGKGGDFVYPIKTDRRIDVTGPLGITDVVIEGGKVRIEDSPCPNKTCIAAGAISQPGQWIACLPNAVFVRIGGDTKESTVDAGTY